jgi:cytochrome c-type biogenesis protein CcmH/NrfG
LPANAALPPRAAALLHQAAAIAPNQPEVLWYLGVDAIHAGRMEDARQDWTKLLSELPGDGQEAKLVKQALDALPRK